MLDLPTPGGPASAIRLAMALSAFLNKCTRPKLAAARTRHAAACFLPRGRNGLSGRLIAPAQARIAVLPPSVQVCVPLSLALRRTKLPLYVASYCRLPLFQLP